MQSLKKLRSASPPNGLFVKAETILDDPIAITISKIDDPYKILNISENASEEDILQSYKKLALKYHPDRHQGQVGSSDFATAIMQKLNAARQFALAQLTRDKEKSNDQNMPLRDYQTFTGYVQRIILSDSLGRMSTENLHLLHSEENYCLAIVLNWVDHALSRDQTSFFKELNPAFSKKSTVESVLRFAKQNHRYISLQMKNNIRDRTLDDLLTKTRDSEDSSIRSMINVTWNFEIQEFSKQIVDIISRSPNNPFVIHNVQDEDAKYIGILYEDERFYLFSPYHLLIDRETNLLRPLNQDEIIHYLVAHYYSLPKMIAYEASYITIPIAICNFAIVPKILLEDMAASSSLVSSHLQLVDYILHRHTVVSANDANRFLQSIRDCYIKGVLTKVYAQSPEFFCLELLYEFLNEAIARDHLLLAFEICNIDPQNKELTQRLGTYYINHYLTDAKDYRHLVSILDNFRKAQIDLGGWINDNLKSQGGSVPKETSMLMDDKAILQCFLGLGFQLNETQRQRLVHQFSTDIDKQAEELKHTLISSSIREREINSKLQDKIESTIQNAIEKMEILIANGYSLHVDHGYLTSNHPFLVLVKAKKTVLAKRYCKEGRINLDAKDKDGNTILNHTTKLKNWEMAAFLCEVNAPYASDPNVPYDAIPVLVGWLKQIESLRPWYLPTQPELMLSLVTKEGDPLCVALAAGKFEQAEFLLANGYLDKLKQTPILYLYQVSKFKGVKLLLDHISLIDSLHLGDQKPKAPDHYCADDLVQELAMEQGVASQSEWSKLIGLSRDEIDQAVSNFPFPSLSKIKIEGFNTVFYSSNVELTEIVSLFFHPDRLLQQIKVIESLITSSEPNQIPDISYCITTLINISTFIDRSLFLLENEENEELFPQYLKKYLHPKTNYVNSFECLNGNEMPLGVQVTWNKEDKVCDFRFIADTNVVLFGDIISCDGKVLRKCDVIDQYRSLSGKIWLMLIRLEQLQLIFEDIFDIKFPATPYYENSSYGESASFLQRFRTEWSEYKKESGRNTEALGIGTY